MNLLAVQGTLKSLLQHNSSILWHSAFFIVQLSHPYMIIGKTIALIIPLLAKQCLCFLICCLGWSCGERNDNPLQYSCLENPVDRGAWRAAVHRVAQSRTRLKQLSMHACIGDGNGNPLQYSCLENPRDRGAWWATVHRIAQSRTRLKQLSMHACIG